MASVFITNSYTDKGPELTFEPYVTLGELKWAGGGTVPTVDIGFAKDTVRIWPADPDDIEALGKKLIKIAERLRFRKPHENA